MALRVKIKRKRKVVNKTDPYQRVWFRGVLLERRTVSALEWVERRFGKQVVITQGSFSTSVNASGATHAGGGALDISVVGLSVKERRRLVRLLRRAGFAAYFRPFVPGLWPSHVHAVLLGNKTASAAAQWQMSEYRAGRNALSNAGPDRAWRPRVPRRWSHRQGRPVKGR